jgi:hypothetical protein
VELALQLLIITPWGEKARILVRIGAFTASFAMLFVLRRSGSAHPAWLMAVASILIVFAEVLHPDTNGVLSGCATAFLYLGVVAPIFWISRTRIDLQTVRRVFFVLWAFNTASAVLGLLQVYYPGQFQPEVSSSMTESYIQQLTFKLADGSQVLRPTGLTNQPGGAAIGATYCVVLGIALLLDRPRVLLRAAIIAGMGCSLFTLCLAQIRGFVVMTLISVMALAVPFAIQGRIRRFVGLASFLSVLTVAGALLAISIGGKSVAERLSTLIDGDPATVYNNSRGIFLKHTFSTLLPEYPLGAGLGRWGVIQPYFGNSWYSKPLWAEIQWTGWLYDGGVPMLVSCASALIVALWVSLRIARRDATAADRELQNWATAVFGYSVGAVAFTFCAIPFASTLGIDFWVLNATVFAASHQARLGRRLDDAAT